MVGVKRLIQEARNIPAIHSPDASQTTAPDLIKSEENVKENETQGELDMNTGENSGGSDLQPLPEPASS